MTCAGSQATLRRAGMRTTFDGGFDTPSNATKGGWRGCRPERHLLHGGTTLLLRAYAISCPRCSCRCVTVDSHITRFVAFSPNTSIVASSFASGKLVMVDLRSAKDFSTSATT